MELRYNASPQQGEEGDGSATPQQKEEGDNNCRRLFRGATLQHSCRRLLLSAVELRYSIVVVAYFDALQRSSTTESPSSTALLRNSTVEKRKQRQLSSRSLWSSSAARRSATPQQKE
jgi:hypothetical protein